MKRADRVNGNTTNRRRKRPASAPRPRKKGTTGRPRKADQQAAIERENLLFEEPYDEDELKTLWRGFRDQPDAVKMLADFGATSKAIAAALIAKWTSTSTIDFTPPPVSPDSWDW